MDGSYRNTLVEVTPCIMAQISTIYLMGIRSTEPANHQWGIPMLLNGGGQLPKLQYVTFIPAGAIMVRRKAFEKVGMQDENLYMYQDERDFAIRLKNAGYKEVVVTDAHAWHQHVNHPNAQGRPLTATYYSARNKIYVTKKHFGGFYATIEFCYNFFYILSLSLSHIVRFQFAKLKYDRIALTAYIDGIWGRLGKVPPMD